VSTPRVIHLVPHTHWDREWYLPFQRFRVRLVDLVDRVLDLLEADERFAFTLDGQTATVDDYLAIRPEAEARIRRLVEQGRLAVGPWRILMDEFLISGETIVRNLFLAAPGSSDERGAGTGSGLAVEGDGVGLSSLRRRGDWLELRLACERPEAGTAVVSGGVREAREADLLGRAGERLDPRDGALSLALAPWEICTLQLKR
jgi:hypothetical protein